MKKSEFVLRFMTVSMLAAAVFFGAFAANDAEHCGLQLDCPENFRNDTIEVPESMVMLTESFMHCSPGISDEGLGFDYRDTVSVMFVIDHSGSMKYRDSTALRYRLVEKLIDSLKLYSPASEVGIVVFSNQLMYDYRDDDFFVQLDNSDGWHDSYVPLTKLNSTVGGMSAVNKLKWAIELDPEELDSRGYNRLLVNGQYGETGRHLANPDGSRLDVPAGYSGGTDISLAFDAVRKAMQSADNPKDKQYVIFFSDGYADFLDYERLSYKEEYVEAEDMPTTFTVYWINRSGSEPVAEQIIDMTDNMRTNGYSTRNSFSAYWTTYGSEVDLLDELINIVSSKAFGFISSSPVDMTINGVEPVDIDSTNVIFQRPFPLEPDITGFEYSATYRYKEPLDKDTTFNFNVYVKRTDDAKEPHLPIICWSDTLALFYNGQKVSFVQPHWTDLEVRFIPDAVHEPDSAALTISNRGGSDYIRAGATKYSSYFNLAFKHAQGSPAADNILQTAQSDSVIVVYRNPEIPLDTIRLAVPVGSPRNLMVQNAYYIDGRDGVADGYPDAVRLVIADTLSHDELDYIKSFIFITSQSRRGFAIGSMVPVSNGADIILAQPSPSDKPPFTGMYQAERLYIDSIPVLPGGGSFPRIDIAISDSMGPVIVSASLNDIATANDTLEVLFSENMMQVGDVTPFLFNRKIEIPRYDVQVIAVSRDSVSAVFSIFPAAGQVEPQYGDSIWIDSVANVSDAGGKAQSGDNIKRILDFRLVYTIISAAYIDTSADGLIDIIRITTDRPPDDELAEMVETEAAKWLPSSRKFKVTGVTATEDGFEIAVTQPPATIPNTSVGPSDVLKTKQLNTTSRGYMEATSMPFTDLLAPVIVKAVFKPGIVRYKGEEAPDTLVIDFSEKVEAKDGPGQFIFYDWENSGAVYSMTLESVKEGFSQKQVYIVESIDGKDFPMDVDSVRIDPTAGIGDEPENRQEDPQNRIVQLELRPYRYYFSVIAAPNPFNPLNTVVYGPAAELSGNNRGMAIIIEPLIESADDMAGHVAAGAKIDIYDVTGNVVRKGLTGYPDNSTRGIVFVWDGKNDVNQRYVGPGTYLACVHIEDNQGFSEDKRLRIGVIAK
jgi:hypothetical protein